MVDLDRLICDYCDRKGTDECPERVDCRRYKFQYELYQRHTRAAKSRYERVITENRRV